MKKAGVLVGIVFALGVYGVLAAMTGAQSVGLTASFAAPNVAGILGCSLGFAAAVVVLVMSLGYWVSAGVIAASLGVGAALAGLIASIAGAIAYKYKRNGKAATVAW